MRLAFLLVVLAAVACDKPDAAADKPAAAASASTPPPAPTPTPPPPATSAPPAASSAPAAGASDAAPVKDAVISVLDPTSQPQKTAKVLAPGSVALYLPEWAGTSWKVTQADKTLGKPKEETIPGFAGPTTPAHAFTWQIKDALKGQVRKVSLVNAAKGGASPSATFTLTIDAS
jgi:hypothetical protein